MSAHSVVRSSSLPFQLQPPSEALVNQHPASPCGKKVFARSTSGERPRRKNVLRVEVGIADFYSSSPAKRKANKNPVQKKTKILYKQTKPSFPSSPPFLRCLACSSGPWPCRGSVQSGFAERRSAGLGSGLTQKDQGICYRHILTN